MTEVSDMAAAAADRHQITRGEFHEAARCFAIKNPGWKWRSREGFLERRVESQDENGRRRSLTTDYHIVYHVSFQVPCLFFVCYGSDGGIVDPGREASGLVIPKKGAVSQQIHPILQVPFWFVHPCDTAALMDKIGGGLKLQLNGYLETWLSLIGPFGGYSSDLPKLPCEQDGQ